MRHALSPRLFNHVLSCHSTRTRHSSDHSSYQISSGTSLRIHTSHPVGWYSIPTKLLPQQSPTTGSQSTTRLRPILHLDTLISSKMSAAVLSAPPSYTESVRRSKSVDHQRRPKQKVFVPDTIDRLDDTAFGGYYHHGGPYDATRPSFNINRKFSPLAATKEGNKAAWEATPRELQMDALLKGRPLDGVGSIPPGKRSMNGQVMDYEEGEDLMRAMNPGGGAYKRWPGVVRLATFLPPPPQHHQRGIFPLTSLHAQLTHSAAIRPQRPERQRRARVYHRQRAQEARGR